MAVDFQTPLVTNVKNAKLLIEAISRNFSLNISNIDAQTSHETVILPGLINVAAFIPGIATSGSNDFYDVTRASISSGFSMIRVMPLGLDTSVIDGFSLSTARSNSIKGAHCDFNFSLAATSSNSNQIGHLKKEVGSLFIPFNHLSDNISKVAAVTNHFDNWPNFKPIVTDAKMTDLASILLLASLHGRRIHVTNVTTKDDIKLIALSKEKGLNVTCDVAVYSLFLSQEDFPTADFLPNAEDKEALWANMNIIDVFSIGSVPYKLAQLTKQTQNPAIGIADTIPILLSAVQDGRLSIDDIKVRLHDNPKRIFEIHDQAGTSVEVVIGRPCVIASSSVWSPFTKKSIHGAVQRVIFHEKTVCLDGEICNEDLGGKDMSTHLIEKHLLHTNSVDTSLVENSFISNNSLPLKMMEVPSTSQGVRSPFKDQHILSVDKLNRQDLHHLFTVAQEMRLGVQREGVLSILKGKVLCTLFYEPSTRTFASFDAAMQRLGGRTVVINPSQSSTTKGESLADTVRTMGCYCDAIILRHPEESSAATAAKFSSVPIINGGNGTKEHPTQALLDLFTIREELGTVTGLTITFTGDLRHGRTVHSLVKLLQHYDVKIQLISPKSLTLPSEVTELIKSKSGQLLIEATELSPDIIARSDVIYCTRIQKERFDSILEYKEVENSFIVDNRTLKNAKNTMIVMHPLPRNDEIREELDFDQRAAYFRQMQYGLYIRMALLALVMAA